MQKPLFLVLVGQVVVLVGALAVLAVQRSAAAPVDPRPEAPAEVPVPLPKVERPAPPKPRVAGAEWEAFPSEGPADAHAARSPEPTPARLGDDEAAPVAAAGPSSLEALISELADGNGRFAEGLVRQRDPIAVRASLAGHERAQAVVVTCTDSRVVPELLFDQPMGSFSVVRLPGAQLDEPGVRAVEEAATRLHVKAVLVLGHLGCHHVKQALSQAAATKAGAPQRGLPGQLRGLLQAMEGDALDEAATSASVSFAARELRQKSKLLARSTDLATLRVLYSPREGTVRWLDAEEPVAEVQSAPRSGRHN